MTENSYKNDDRLPKLNQQDGSLLFVIYKDIGSLISAAKQDVFQSDLEKEIIQLTRGKTRFMIHIYKINNFLKSLLLRQNRMLFELRLEKRLVSC